MCGCADVLSVQVSCAARSPDEPREKSETDGEGQFHIAGLPPGIYELSAKAEAFYGEGVEQVHLGLAQTVDDLVVTVHPAVSVAASIRVVETSGSCSEGYAVLESDDGRYWARPNDEGEVLFQGVLPDEYEVSVSCSNYLSEPEYEAVIVADQSLSGIEWLVHTGSAVRGVVVDSAGAPVAGISVSASAKTTAGEDPRGQRSSSWGSKSEDDGSFEVRGLLPGSYELKVWSQDYPRLAEPELIEVGESSDLEGVRLVLPGAGRLEGFVRDEQGRGIAGVTVHASALGERSETRQTQTGDDGDFAFERLATGAVRVQAVLDWSRGMRAPGTTDDDVQGQSVEIVADEVVEVELIVEGQSLSIAGQVVDSTGAPVFDAFVDAVRVSDSAAASSGTQRWAARWGWDRQPVLSDQDGSFEIDELAQRARARRSHRRG